jgi:hypothetical protein
MGSYFNPPKEIPHVGRLLTKETTSFSALTKFLQTDELLVGYYLRQDLPFDNAVHLFSQDEFNAFELQIPTGNLVREGFYAVKKDVFHRTV